MASSPDKAVSEGGKSTLASKLPTKALDAEEGTALTNLQREIMQNSRKYARYQVLAACTACALMIVQHELGYHANTAVGYALPCAPACALPITDLYSCTEPGYAPFCVTNTTDGEVDVGCCDPRVGASMFPALHKRTAMNAIRAVISVLTLILLWMTYNYYSEGLRYSITRNLASTHHTVLGSRLRWSFLTEAAIQCVHCFPNCDKVGGEPTLYLFLCFFMFARLYLFGRLFRHYSDLNSVNGRFIGALTRVEYTVTFVMKNIIKQNPFPLLVTGMVVFFLFAGYTMSRVESVMCAYRSSLNCYPLSFLDAMWLVCTTVLTIGFGDFYPHSSGGRVVAVLAAMVGMLVSTATIAIAVGFLSLSRSESKVISFMSKGHLRKEVLLHAVCAVQAALRFKLATAKFRVDAGRTRANSTRPLERLGTSLTGANATVRYPPHIQKLEQRMYDAIESYRNKKRCVSTLDSTTMEDRQLTLLESMAVNAEQLKTATAAIQDRVESELLDSARVVPLELPNVFHPSQPHRAKPDIPLAPLAIPKVEFDAELLNRGPEWMRELSSSLVHMCATMDALTARVADVQHSLTAHIDTTNNRLATLERWVDTAAPQRAGTTTGPMNSSRGSPPVTVTPEIEAKSSSTGLQPRKAAAPSTLAVRTSLAAGEDKGRQQARPHKASYRSPIVASRGLNDSDSD